MRFPQSVPMSEDRPGVWFGYHFYRLCRDLNPDLSLQDFRASIETKISPAMARDISLKSNGSTLSTVEDYLHVFAMAAESHFAPHSFRQPATNTSRASPRPPTRVTAVPERPPHPRKDQPRPDQNRAQRGQDGGPRKCYNCGKPGHIAARCSEPLSAAAIAILDAHPDHDEGDSKSIIEDEYVQEATSQWVTQEPSVAALAWSSEPNLGPYSED